MSAKEETSDYKLDPNYAVVCSFLEKFGKILYEDPAHLCIENLDSFLVSENVPKDHGFLKLHMKLLKGIGSKAQYEKWERGFMKFSEDFPERDDKLIEEHGYAKIPVAAKLRILKNLFEDQFEFNNGFNVKVNDLLAEEDELRHLPLGTDKQGRDYWYIMDKLGSMRLYRSMRINSTGKETWTLVCSEADELKDLIESLQSYEEKEEEEKEDPILEDQEIIPPDKLAFKTDFLKITDDEIEEFLSETKRPFSIYYKFPKARSLKQIDIDEAKHSLKHCFIKISQTDRTEVEKWEEKQKEKMDTVEESKSEPKAGDDDNQGKSNLETKSEIMETVDESSNNGGVDDDQEKSETKLESKEAVGESIDKGGVDNNLVKSKGDSGYDKNNENQVKTKEDEEEIQDKMETDQENSVTDRDNAEANKKSAEIRGDETEICIKMETDQDKSVLDETNEKPVETKKDEKEVCVKMETDQEKSVSDSDNAEINEKQVTSKEDEKGICVKMETDENESDDKALQKTCEKSVKTSKEKEVVKVGDDGHESRNQTRERKITKENGKKNFQDSSVYKHDQISVKTEQSDCCKSTSESFQQTSKTIPETEYESNVELNDSGKDISVGKTKDHSPMLDVNDDLKTDQFEDDLDMKETLMRISELSGSFSGQFSKSDKDSENNKISDKKDEVTGTDKTLTIEASMIQSKHNLPSENGNATESEKVNVSDEGSNDKKAFDDAIKGLMTLEGIINQGKTILSSNTDEEADRTTDTIISCAESSSHITDLPSVTLVSDIQGKENIIDEKGDNKCEGKITDKDAGEKITDKKGEGKKNDNDAGEKITDKKGEGKKNDETDGGKISDEKVELKISDEKVELKISDEKDGKRVSDKKWEAKISEEKGEGKISDKNENETSPLLGNYKLDISEFQKQDMIENEEGSAGNVHIKQEPKDACAGTFKTILSVLNGNKSSVNVNDGVQVKLEKEDKGSLKMKSNPSKKIQSEKGTNVEKLNLEDSAKKKDLKIKLERIDEIFNRKKLDMEKDLNEFIEYETKNVKYNSVSCVKDSEEMNGKVVDARCKEEFTKMFESYDQVTSQKLKSPETSVHVNGTPRGNSKQGGNNERSPKLAQQLLIDGDVIEINEMSSDESSDELCITSHDNKTSKDKSSKQDTSDGFERNKHLAKEALKVMNNRKYTTEDPSRRYKLKQAGSERQPKQPKAERKKKLQPKAISMTPIIDFTMPSFMNQKDRVQVFKLGPKGLIPQPSKIDVSRIPSHDLSTLYQSQTLVQKQPVQYIQYLNPTGPASNIVYMNPKSLPGNSSKSGSSVTPSNLISAPNVLKMLSGKVVTPGNSVSSPHMVNLLPGNIVKLSNSVTMPNVVTLSPGNVVKSGIPGTVESNENKVLPGKPMTPSAISVDKPKVMKKVTLDLTKPLQPKSIVIPANPVTRSLLSNMNVKILPKLSAQQPTLVNTALKSSLPGQPGIPQTVSETENQLCRYNVQHPTKNVCVFQGQDGQFYEKGTGRAFNVPQNGRRVALGADKRFYDCQTGERVNVNIPSHMISTMKPGMSFLLVPARNIQTDTRSFVQSKASNKNKELISMLRNKVTDQTKVVVVDSNRSQRKSKLRQSKKMILIDDSDSSDIEGYEAEDSDGNGDCDQDGDADVDVDVDSDYDYDSISRRVREATFKESKLPAKKPSYIEISEEEMEELPDLIDGGTQNIIEISDDEKKIKAKKVVEQFELGEYPCTICETSDLPPTILTCDDCDSTYHMGCLTPPLLLYPVEEWFCPLCEHKMLVETLQEKYRELRRRLYSVNRKKDKISTKMFAINRENIMEVNRSVRTRKEVNYDETKFDKMVKNADDKRSTKQESAKSSMKDSDESDNPSASDNELTDSPGDNKDEDKEKEAPAQTKSVQNSRSGRIRKEVNYDDTKFDNKRTKRSAKSRMKDSDESDNTSASDNELTDSPDDIKNDGKEKEKRVPAHTKSVQNSRSGRTRKEVNYDDTKFDNKRSTKRSAKSRMKDSDESDNTSASDNELTDSPDDNRNERKKKEKTAPPQTKSDKNSRSGRIRKEVNYDDTKFDNKRSTKKSAKSRMKDSDESDNTSASDNELTDSPDDNRNERKKKEKTAPAQTKSDTNSRSGRIRKEVNYDDTKFDNKRSTKKSAKSRMKDSNESDNTSASDNELTDSPGDIKNEGKEEEKTAPDVTKSVKSSRSGRTRKELNYDDTKFDKKRSTKGSAKSSMKDSDESDNPSASDNEHMDSPDDNKNERKKKERTVPAQTKSVKNSRSSRSRKEVDYDEAKFEKKRSAKRSAKARMKVSDESDNPSASDNELTDSPEDIKNEGKEEEKTAKAQTKSVQNNRSGRSRKGVNYDETKPDEIVKNAVKDINKSDKKRSNKSMKDSDESDNLSASDNEQTDSPDDSKKVKEKEKSKPSETKSVRNVRKRSHRHTESTDTNDTEPTKRKVQKFSESKSDKTDRKSVVKGKEHSEKKKKLKGSKSGKKEKRKSLENRDERHISKLRGFVPADGDSDFSMSDADQHDSDSNSESGDPEDYGDGIDKKKDPEDHVYYTSSGRKTNSLAKLKDAF